MKIASLGQFMVLAKESRISETNGKTYYSITILQGTEAGSIGCNKQVYDTVTAMQNYTFCLNYNDQYKSLNCVAIAEPDFIANYFDIPVLKPETVPASGPVTTGTASPAPASSAKPGTSAPVKK